MFIRFTPQRYVPIDRTQVPRVVPKKKRPPGGGLGRNRSVSNASLTSSERTGNHSRPIRAHSHEQQFVHAACLTMGVAFLKLRMDARRAYGLSLCVGGQRHQRRQWWRPQNQAHNDHVASLAGNYPMRDWLLVLAPLATALYFTIHPDQFRASLDWLTRLLP
jgi:hypothetical protein